MMLSKKTKDAVTEQAPRDAACRLRLAKAKVLCVLVLVLLVGLVVVSFDIGRMHLVDTELLTAVDAGVLAASLKLQQDPDDIDGAISAARTFVRSHDAGWLKLFNENQISVDAGTWHAPTRTFTSTTTDPSAIRIAALRTSKPFILGRIFGHSQFLIQQTIALGKASPIDLMLVLDLSGSIQANGRIEAMRKSLPVFLDVIDGYHGDDHIGVAGFGGGTARIEGNLTNDLCYVRNSVLTSDKLAPARYGSSTPTGLAIQQAADYLDSSSFARASAKKVIVLMSAGRATRPDGNGTGYAEQQAAYARSLGIEVYTISLGMDADCELMENIATLTDAMHFEATGSRDGDLTVPLTRALEQTAASIKRTTLVN